MLIDWLLYPLVLAAASTGHGLLVRRITGAPSGLLILPAGFAAMIVWCSLAMKVGPFHSVAWLAIVLPAVTGWVTVAARARQGWPHRLRLPREARLPTVVALAVFAAYAAPVVLSGQASFTGYSTIIDTARHFDLTGWLIAHGTRMPDITSSQTEVVSGLLSSSYPIGFSATLGAGSELFARDLPWIFQPTVALGGPMAALSVFSVLGRFGLPSSLRCLGAFVCAQPTLLYSISLAAGFKELYGFGLVVLAAAILSETQRSGPLRQAAVLVPIAAGYFVFDLTIAPWFGVVVAIFVLTALLRVVGRSSWPLSTRAPTWRGLALGGCVVAVLAIGIRIATNVRIPAIVTAQSEIGDLAAPMPTWSSFGIWLTGDYRYPLTTNVQWTYVLIGSVLILALAGIVNLLARRETAGIALAAAALVPLIFLVPRTSPWVDVKFFAIAGGLTLIGAYAGVALVHRSAVRLAGWIVALVVSGAVLYGNALAYHDTTLAPVGRLRSLETIGSRFAGVGPALVPSFDEYAQYLLRQLDASERSNPAHGLFPGPGNFGADINQVDFPFLEQFRLLVLRRGPDRTRPPSNYRLVYRDRYYDVWRQATSPKPILIHEVLPANPADRTSKYCRALTRNLRGAPGSTRLIWATRPTSTTVYPLAAVHSAGWPGDTGRQGVVTVGPGRIDANPLFPRSGRYALWVQGSFQRPVRFTVDGRLVGTLAYEADYPLESHFVGYVTLLAGSHHVSAIRGGGSLRPGNGDAENNRYIGPLFFQLPQDTGGTLLNTTLQRAPAQCQSGSPLAWVEAIRR